MTGTEGAFVAALVEGMRRASALKPAGSRIHIEVYERAMSTLARLIEAEEI